MKCGIGTTAEAIVNAASSVGVKLTRNQVSNYFDGRNEPSRSVVNPLAERLGMPDLRMVSEWPWELLTPRQLTLGEIEKICAPPYKTVFRLPKGRPASFNRRGRSRWHEPRKFRPAVYCLLSPEAPEVFWLHVAHVRAALALKDYESFNAHFFSTIKLLPSIAQHRAVRPHIPMLLSCVGMLLEHIGPHFRWFCVNWGAVKVSLATEMYQSQFPNGADDEEIHRAVVLRSDWSGRACDQVFSDFFRGNSNGVGVEYELRSINQFHPENFIKRKRSTR